MAFFVNNILPFFVKKIKPQEKLAVFCVFQSFAKKIPTILRTVKAIIPTVSEAFKRLITLKALAIL
jgi:hypothetical protein